MFRLTAGLALFLAAVLVAGCQPNGDTGGGPPSDPGKGPRSEPGALAEGKKLLLESEPSGGRGVVAVRKEAKDGDRVVVVGQVGGSARPFVQGRAGFLLVDPSLRPTFECDCPWDFCELPKKQ